MLARTAPLPPLAEGGLVAVLQSGAYGLTASPTGFLSHPTPAEVLVEGGQAAVIRARG
jgi:diaminopimelate decarboxylase